MVVSRNKKIGDLGEAIACRFLVKKGFSIVYRNYRKKWGEIDVIAKKDSVTHFVEVKTVSRVFGENKIRFSPSDTFTPAENIHSWKIKRLSRVINTYLSENDDRQAVEQEWQIDAIIVFVDQNSKKARVKLIEVAS